MAEANELALAKKVFEDLCAALDRRKWPYQKHEEDLVVTCSVASEDIPMNFILVVNVELQVLMVVSRLPFTVPEDKRMELAIATCAASYGLADGSFDYNIADGMIGFRLTASFRESEIGDGLFEYLIACASMTVDRYNDKFLALCKGLISIDDFLTQR